MFEKEAEEWVKENMDCCKTDNSVNQPIPYFDEEERCVAKSAFQDGAEFGFNKANEWHYPSKGELPKEDTAEKETLYLLWFGLDDSDYITGVFARGRFWCFDSGWFEASEVVAWKEIVCAERPKESK